MNLKYYLRIFQLEGYKIPRFLRWICANYALQYANAKDPTWTPKAKLLYRMSLVVFLLLVLCSGRVGPVFAVAAAALLVCNSYVLLIISLLIMRPYEIANRWRVKWSIARKIASFPNLTVVGITGSYGKTSTKMVLQPLLPQCLMTPKSYNTMFGIHKVVDYELSERFRFFICEMGAYKVGDIKEFCQLTRPHLGILTGINEQHYERFGSLENTITAKFEILQYLRPGATGIVNLDNEHVRTNLGRSKVPLIGYSIEGIRSDACKEHVFVVEWSIRNAEMHFVLEIRGQREEFVCSLLGRAHLSNIVAAITAAVFLGEEMPVLKEKVSRLKQIPHRLECRKLAGLTLLDNGYSSNPDGFREALGVLRWFEGKKVLVTPGIVELGDKVAVIHQQLGQLAAQTCDEVVLVGESPRTAALLEGLRTVGFAEHNVSRLRRGSEIKDFLAARANSGQVILIENDLPDNYLG